jgi:flavin reductase (DIM6/NTAB) family NADH-FMN oxidoreductase RutF
MRKSPVPLASAYHLLNPGSVVLVSVGDATRDNLLAITWNMPAYDDPPVVALLMARGHFSFPFVENTRELGINIPDASLVDALYGCGTTSGRRVRDKFARFGLTRRRARRISVPLVAEAVANLECRVRAIHDVEGAALILADVVAAVAATEHFADGKWRFEHGLTLVHHLDGARFGLSDRVVRGRRPRIPASFHVPTGT